jgi:hypothetical protein
MAEETSSTEQPERPTWGPYPGDKLAPPPTPQAPEIPMSESWPWVAGIAVALRVLLPIVLGLVVLGVIIGLIVHFA